MGANQRYQSPLWHSVLKLIEILVRSEDQQEKSVNNPFHVHGQNILPLLSKDRVGLIKWATLWKLKEPQSLSEIKEITLSPQSLLISKEATPNLFEVYAKPIFSLPVNNVLAERQFILSQLYVNDNMSKLLKQASITFVENILHRGKTNTRTTSTSTSTFIELIKSC